MNSNFHQMAKPRRNPDNLLMGLVVFFVILVVATVITGIVMVVHALSEPTKVAAQVVPTPSNQVVTLPEGVEYQKILQDNSGPEPVSWNGSGRVNMLIMGLDYRDWSDAPNEPSRTDSMILLTMDPVTNNAGMLSIPRDLWVNIPGYGEDKINTAYFNGEADKLPGGGAGMAVKTVESLLGITINYYAVIDFNAFVKFIDETGGVDIYVNDDIVVDPLGPGNAVLLREGLLTLDGATALAYARARNTDHGDFDRAARQQQVILAIRDNIINYYGITKLVSNALPIYRQLASGVKTNLTLRQGLMMAYFAQKIPEGNIHRGVIEEPEYATATFNTIGQYVLLPIPDQVSALLAQVFGENGANPDNQASVDPATGEATQPPVEGTPTQEAIVENTPTEVPPPPLPTETPDPQKVVADEAARVSVQNGSQVAGLASRTAFFLRGKGVDVVEETNADSLYPVTEIHVSGNKPATVRLLAETLNVTDPYIYNQGSEQGSNLDIIVILGSDWAALNPPQ
jgi:polyisoprenyl-teichoic acid--peptidoglycan teichoic acid transferase